MPTLSIGFGGEDGGGIYHSIYDDFYWYTHFSDTSFVYGRALAQTAGTMVMRMANADLLPQEFGNLAETVRGYVTELKALARRGGEEDHGDEPVDRRGRVRGGERSAAAADGAQAGFGGAVPELRAGRQCGDRAYRRAATRFEKAYASSMTSGVSAATLSAVNDLLRQTDEALLLAEGLPKRPWYEHSLYAPGLYTGYGVKTMPGAREAIEQKDWKQADAELGRIAAALAREIGLISRAAALLERRAIQ